MKNVHANVKTSFSPEVSEPDLDPTAYVHPLAAVIGAVHIGKRVMVSPAASVRGDEGQPLWIGDESNVQDGVILHALETWEDGEPVEDNLVTVDGEDYAIYVGDRVSLAHQVHIHGPSFIGDDTFVGMQSMVFKSKVGEGCVIEPKSLVMGVEIADGHYVPAGSVIKTQKQADALSEVTEDYAFKDLNAGVVHVNVHLADAYNASGVAE
jgi:carbonic anhydrase/acetyltransferase-like protein (isoleucine patch superfamily)